MSCLSLESALMERCPYSSCHSCPMEVSLSSSSITEINWYVYVITPFGVVLLIYPPATRGRVRPRGRADKPQHHDKRCDKMLLQVATASFPGNAAASARFPVHRPYTGPFTSVLRERFSMAASSSSFLRAFWLVLPIVSVFDRALDRVGE